MAVPEVKFGGSSCFCGQIIEAGGVDPLELLVTTAIGDLQVWWCHAACFKGNITDPPDVPGIFAPAHF